MQKKIFGKNEAGKDIYIFTLENTYGARARIMTLGACVVSFEVPDTDGKLTDIVLGFDDLDEYLAGHPSVGVICGRYANRIDQGRFILDDKNYQVSQNHQHGNHLHGGFKGFDKQIWDVVETTEKGEESLTLKYVSADGEEGYPGQLEVWVTYTLTSENALRIDYEAKTDAPTVLNLTNHSYFNLAGQGSVLDYQLTLFADHFTPINERVIPTGEIRAVAATPFDFRTPKAIGVQINDADEQLGYGSGYDHNFVLNSQDGSLAMAARAFDPVSGRTLEVFTTEPGVQLYTANHLDGRLGKKGVSYQARHAFCLETQHYPDSPNHANFPSTVLRPGEVYRQTTVYAIS